MTTFSYSTDAASAVRTGVLVLPVFQGPEPGPGVREVGLAQAYRDARLTGKLGETLLVTRRDRDRFEAGAVLLVGVGPKGSFDVTRLRRSLGRVASGLTRFGTVATTFPQALGARHAADAVQAAAEGIALGAYRFDRYKTKGNGGGALSRVRILGSSRWPAAPARAAVKHGQIVSEAVAWARDLVNTPAGDLLPRSSRARRSGWLAGSACAARFGGGPSSSAAASGGSSGWARAA
ncbi:MAG: M17 family peptidase N-terminal domain-containing protein [Actinomycetota bacterium]